ncbi:MAG: hypothetical protein ACFBSC_15805 [Microcoleaceae cyanobacterium]
MDISKRWSGHDAQGKTRGARRAQTTQENFSVHNRCSGRSTEIGRDASSQHERVTKPDRPGKIAVEQINPDVIDDLIDYLDNLREHLGGIEAFIQNQQATLENLSQSLKEIKQKTQK